MFTIGNVARQVGVRPSALRYYEAQGILRPAVRGANDYRFYSEDAVKLMLFVRRAQALGITLKEIKPLLTLVEQGQQPCHHVKQVIKRRLNDVNEKLRELQLLRKELRSLLKRKTGLPRANKVCPLIERA